MVGKHMGSNLLFLSVGRRVELIQRFKNAREKLNVKGKIIAVDMKKDAPALYFADNFEIIPSVKDINYISELKRLCSKYNIDLIVPTIDTELLVLAENRKEIEDLGVKLLLSNINIIEISNDKIKTNKFFKKHNIDTPEIISKDDLKNSNFKYPLFIKPRSGSSSFNTFKIKNKKELDFFSYYVHSHIITEYISGDEYSIDVFTDFESNPITIVPRLRIATRSGEISKGKIVKDELIINTVKRIIDILKPIGPITIQCIKNDKCIKFIEINPRFGGGVPMSMEAGADSAENIYKLLQGINLEPYNDYKQGLFSLRYDQAVFLNK
ncbi:MAG: ATP-grasp domain-containing protein [bacterium]